MENDTVTVANTNKKHHTNKQKLDKNDNTKPKWKPHDLYIKACVPATSTTQSRPPVGKRVSANLERPP